MSEPAAQPRFQIERFLAVVGGSLVFPGLGHGLAGKRRLMTAWVIAGVVATIVVPWSIWAIHLSVAIRIACAIDAMFRIRGVVIERAYGSLAAIAAVIGTGALT